MAKRGRKPGFSGWNKGKGAAHQWLLDHLSFKGDGCLIWPFARDPHVGRGQLGHNGNRYWAHRLMCQLVHGDPPTPEHTDAGHLCGKGHTGCVNPKHLAWRTKAENQLDRREHGTKHNAYWGKKGKLTPEQVIEIRSLRGKKTQIEIASMFNISDTNIRAIQSRRTWRHL